MRVAIMQPYFFPYIGYFQLINAVDEFIVYDNIEYTKKGWINRNRILVNGSDTFITLPLRKGSDYLNVTERFLAVTWKIERKKLLNRINEAYKKAPRFETTYLLVEKCLLFDDSNLFNFIYNSLDLIKEHLNITTNYRITSNIDINHSLKADKKVIALCQSVSASTYINPIGGKELYSKDIFKENDIDLIFLKTKEIKYKQFENEFIPHLSIIDVLMFNSKDRIQTYLNNYYILL